MKKKRAASILAVVLALLAVPRVRCFLLGHTAPVRAYVGGDHRGGLAGHRCGRCGTVMDAERVNPDRHIGPRGHELDGRFRRAQR